MQKTLESALKRTLFPAPQTRRFRLEMGIMYAQFGVLLMAHEAEPAVISAILLSDMSIVEQGTQKRSLIGCFDRFAFNQFPARYGTFFITASITNIEGTFEKLEVTFRIEKKGHVVFSNSMTIQFGPPKTMKREEVIGLSVGVPGIVFPEPGVYTTVVLLDGDEIGKRDFGVIQVPVPQG